MVENFIEFFELVGKCFNGWIGNHKEAHLYRFLYGILIDLIEASFVGRIYRLFSGGFEKFLFGEILMFLIKWFSRKAHERDWNSVHINRSDFLQKPNSQPTKPHQIWRSQLYKKFKICNLISVLPHFEPPYLGLIFVKLSKNSCSERFKNVFRLFLIISAILINIDTPLNTCKVLFCDTNLGILFSSVFFAIIWEHLKMTEIFKNWNLRRFLNFLK